MSEALHVVVLAAGQGKRMHSDLPKVLHPVLFRPMLHHVIDLAKALKPQSITVVVGHGEDQVRASCEGIEGIEFVTQAEQRGTGHAVQQAAPKFENLKGRVLVLSGDVILLTLPTVQALLAAKGRANVLTARLSDAASYGRILRSDDGSFLAIREAKDCSEAEKLVDEVNSGVYVFEIPALVESLKGLGDNNHQGEFYLTDVIEILSKKGEPCEAVCMKDSDEMAGANDRADLAQVEGILRTRVNRAWMRQGVGMQDPATTWIDSRCSFGQDVYIEAGCRIVQSTISSGAYIESQSRITNSKVGRRTRVKQGSVIDDSKVGADCAVGPYAHIRPGCELADEVKIGNFVELKKASMGKASKASHLSYIGDAEIGSEVNIGCGFVTCNYDGKKKHRTIIEDGVFVGSDSQTIAPVKIGKGSYVASGSTVTKDVPPDSLVFSRGKQTTKPGYALRYKKDE